MQATIPHSHYDHWSMLMEKFLRTEEYWSIVEVGITPPAEGETLTNAQTTEFEEIELKDLKAKNYLFWSIKRLILETIL